MKRLSIFVLVLPLLLSCCKSERDFSPALDLSAEQIHLQLAAIADSGRVLYPVTLRNEAVVYGSDDDWRLGFFPGCLWEIYRLTGNPEFLPEAEKFTWGMESAKNLTGHHDIGFMIGSSFLQGYRTTRDTSYVPVIITAAKSLCTRFRPGAGVIQSWDADKGWQGLRGWQCPVIIDNMMNLELLFEASLLSGDNSFRDIAVSHADRTLENHFRQDGSCFHVVDYDLSDGSLRSRQTAQGYSDDSSWARGQAWALYGYTMCYRYTSEERYLSHAQKVAGFILDSPTMPSDLIPYWDFDAPGIPDEPRDASAAAVIASALYELYSYDRNARWLESADRIVESLCSEDYLESEGGNGGFILKHSVGSIPHGSEVDAPLVYADYYFLEAIERRNSILL